MKTREEIYSQEGASLLHIITTYHALTYEQVIRSFRKKPDTISHLIQNLLKQGRIYYDPDKNLLLDRPEAADEANAGIIAAYWVMLDFEKAVVYHTSGEFPVTINFFSNAEEYEIIYDPEGKEFLLNRIHAKQKTDANRLVIVSTPDQARELHIPHVLAFCTVASDGTVSYYQKGGDHS